MPNSTPRILVFDSGVGGLSVLGAIHARIPGAELLFASDNGGFPYGTREEADLVSRVERVLGVLVDELRPDLVVVACNSASTVVLPVIRARFPLPIVGVVPAIKPAATLTRTGSIGLLATPATIRRTYTDQLIRDFASTCHVIRIGSSELVYQAERKLRGQAVGRDALAAAIAPFWNDGADHPVDTVVLACTHFPLLQEELKLLAPDFVQWIDSGEAIARRVASLLPELEGRAPTRHPLPICLTAPDPTLQSLTAFLAPIGNASLRVIPV